MDLSDDLLSVDELTTREREILELTACGMSAKQIAQEVEIAPRTVERHLENVRHKLRARNKSHMIAKAVALGVLHVGRVRSGKDSAVVSLKPKFAANE